MPDSPKLPVPAPSLFSRLWRGAVELSPLETELVHLFVENMPDSFRPALVQQLSAANLVQRDPEWAEVRFYTLVGGKVDRSGLPQLPVKPGEVKLLSMSVDVGEGEPLHANFWSVDRCFVMINTDRSTRPFREIRDFDVLKVRQSWRSNMERLEEE